MNTANTAAMAIVWVLLSMSALADVSVPETGQTRCFDTSGTEIVCSGTRQDGDLRSGVEWPTPRFSDNGNGTVTDSLTGLLWVQQVLCASEIDWQAALDHANALADGQCGLSDGSVPGDWRLPNIRELLSVFDYNTGIPALTAGHPFLAPDVPSGFGGWDWAAWSSTTVILEVEPSEHRAYGVVFSAGVTIINEKTAAFPNGAWAVRDAPPPPTQCSDGVDNDGDGLIDLDDHQCRSAGQNSETHPRI